MGDFERTGTIERYKGVPKYSLKPRGDNADNSRGISGASMYKRIVTATPLAVDLGPETVPILPHWVLSGTPITRIKQLLRSRDWTSNIVVWECTAGSFNWHYNQDEMVVIVSGEVFITNEKAEERRLVPGDMAFFPAGTSAIWRVPMLVRKVAIVRETVWWPLGFALKAYKKLLRMVGLGGESPL